MSQQIDWFGVFLFGEGKSKRIKEREINDNYNLAYGATPQNNAGFYFARFDLARFCFAMIILSSAKHVKGGRSPLLFEYSP